MSNSNVCPLFLASTMHACHGVVHCSTVITNSLPSATHMHSSHGMYCNRHAVPPCHLSPHACSPMSHISPQTCSHPMSHVTTHHVMYHQHACISTQSSNTHTVTTPQVPRHTCSIRNRQAFAQCLTDSAPTLPRPAIHNSVSMSWRSC